MSTSVVTVEAENNGERVLITRASHDVTPADAARILGVTRQFVDRLCAEGVLLFHRLPDSRHRRISVDDVVRVAGERDQRRSGRAAIKAALDVE